MTVPGITPAIDARISHLKEMLFDLDARLLTVETPDDFRAARALARDIKILRETILSNGGSDGGYVPGAPEPPFPADTLGPYLPIVCTTYFVRPDRPQLSRAFVTIAQRPDGRFLCRPFFASRYLMAGGAYCSTAYDTIAQAEQAAIASLLEDLPTKCNSVLESSRREYLAMRAQIESRLIAARASC